MWEAEAIAGKGADDGLQAPIWESHGKAKGG